MPEKTKHTPGPWRVIEEEGCDRYGIDSTELSIIVFGSDELDEDGGCGVQGNTREEMAANADIIAAAPETAEERDGLRESNADLIEALKTLLGEKKVKGIDGCRMFCDTCGSPFPDSDRLCHHEECPANIARAAIAKAIAKATA